MSISKHKRPHNMPHHFRAPSECRIVTTSIQTPLVSGDEPKLARGQVSTNTAHRTPQKYFAFQLHPSRMLGTTLAVSGDRHANLIPQSDKTCKLSSRHGAKNQKSDPFRHRSSPEVSGQSSELCELSREPRGHARAHPTNPWSLSEISRSQRKTKT